MNRKILIVLSALIIIVSAAVIAVQGISDYSAKNEAAGISKTESSLSAEMTDSETETPAVSGDSSSSKPAAAQTTAAVSTSSTTSGTTRDKSEKTTAERSANTSTEKSKAGETTVKSTAGAKTTTAQKTTAPNSAVPKTTTAKSTTETTKKSETTKSSTTKAGTSATDKKSFNVTVSISCKNALSYIPTLPQSGYFLTATACTVQNGDTVFDLLAAVCKKNSISLTYQSIYYIQGIGGLNEKDCTPQSGWMYRVNGVTPRKAACNYTLSDGDTVEWYYVTSASDK